MHLRALLFAFALLAGCGEVIKAHPDAAPPASDAAPDAANVCGSPGAKPDPAFTSAPDPAQRTFPVTFTPATSGMTYAWTFAGGNPASSTSETPSATWSAAGPTNDVMLVVTNPANNCSANMLHQIAVNACQPVLSTPVAFTQNTSGHTDSGIVIRAKVNTTLTSFKVVNQGQADTLKLLDSANTVVQSTALPAASAAYVATVSWPLAANTTYKLVTALNNNNQYAFIGAGQYPQETLALSVDAGWMDGANQSPYWFGFTELVTCP